MADMEKRLSYTATEIDERLAKTDDIDNKVDKETGKGLSTNDYSDAEQSKLSGLTQYTDAMAKSTVYGLGSSIASNTDLNTYKTPGVYNCTPSVAATLSHCPTSQSLRLEVRNFASASSYIQTIFTPESTTSGEVVVYRRFMLSNAWKPWYKFTGTEVT